PWITHRKDTYLPHRLRLTQPARSGFGLQRLPMSRSRQKFQGLRLERMRASRQYADGGFINTYPASTLRDLEQKTSLVDFMFRGKEHRVPARPLPSLDPRAAWTRRVQSGLRATWLGHSTVLL